MQPEQALGLLREMRRQSVEPEGISCDAAISACEKGVPSERALDLLLRRVLRATNLAGEAPAAGHSTSASAAGHSTSASAAGHGTSAPAAGHSTSALRLGTAPALESFSACCFAVIDVIFG